jgi:hypothetical protein
VQWQVNRCSSGQWIGLCEPLGLTAEGKSLKDLGQNIERSIQRLMEDLTSTGEIDSFLSARGWRGMPAARRRQQDPTRYQMPIQLVVHFGYTKR